MSIVTYDRDCRVMCFIDLRNIFNRGFDKKLKVRVDLKTMVEMIAEDRRVVGAYVFDGAPRGDNFERDKNMHYCLQRLGFRLKVRDAYDDKNGVQKEVDVDMGTEMVDQAADDTFDVAVVVSGDRDFIPAIERVIRRGKIVEVASFRDSISNDMICAADRFHNLSTMPILKVDRSAVQNEEEAEDVVSVFDVTAEAM